MSPEAINYFEFAERQLEQALRAFNAELYEFAARESYIAALSAARANIFELTGNAPKTHSGARAQLSKLEIAGHPIEDGFLSFLATGFEMKSDLDYGPVTPVQRVVAEQSRATARKMVNAARTILARD